MILALLHPFPDAVVRLVRERLGAGVELRVARSSSMDDLGEAVCEAEYAVAYATPIPATVFSAARRLRLLHKWGAGVDTIDLDAARRSGVIVARTAGANADAVADLAVGLMLAVQRRIVRQDRAMRAGGWADDQDWLEGCSLSGSTVGLVGLGRIGAAVARRLRGFDCTVLAARRDGSTAAPNADVAERVPLLDLLARADIVSLHLPLTATTRAMIGPAEIARMRPTSILINTARGGLVDESALVRALTTGGLRGAGLDVFEREPLAADHPLRMLPSVVLSPHVGGRTLQSATRTIDHWATNVERHARGAPVPDEDLVA